MSLTDQIVLLTTRIANEIKNMKSTANNIKNNKCQYAVPNVGDWIISPGFTYNKSTANGELLLGNIYIPEGTYDSIAFSCSNAGSTGSVTKCVLYSNVSNRPGSLLLDSPTISTATSGTKQIQGFTLTIPTGGQFVWAGLVTQGGPTTNPFYVHISSQEFPYIIQTTPYFGSEPTGITQTNVTGTAPTTITTNTVVGLPGYAKLGFRRSS